MSLDQFEICSKIFDQVFDDKNGLNVLFINYLAIELLIRLFNLEV